MNRFTLAIARTDYLEMTGVHTTTLRRIDILETGERFRLWVGYRGNLKLVPVITAAHDTEGTVLVSSKAAIRLVASPVNNNSESIGALWTEQDTQRKLLEVIY